ncbi:MAG: DUF6084 family protein [Candidatus Acidiferrales bacterium]
MPELNFKIEGAEAVAYAAVPTIAFKLRVANMPAEQAIHTVVLRAQIQIESTRRHYSADEQARLVDLFGDPDRWSLTLKTMLWTHANLVVPEFTGESLLEMPVPCTFDFNVAATKYFHALEDGDLPLLFLFSGTVFYQDESGTMQVAPISWDKEAKFRLPVRVWRDLIDSYYPNSAWLNVRKDVFDRLYQYKVRCGIPTWEQTLERVLDSVEETAKP